MVDEARESDVSDAMWMSAGGQVVLFTETPTEYCIMQLENGGFECEAKRTTATGQVSRVPCQIWKSMEGDSGTRTCNHIIKVRGKVAEKRRLPADRMLVYEDAFCEAFRTGNKAKAWHMRTSEDC